jgi:hypothetical protein
LLNSAATPDKPLIQKFIGRHPLGVWAKWRCGARNGHGVWVFKYGETPEIAYRAWKKELAALEQMGMRWEIFP